MTKTKATDLTRLVVSPGPLPPPLARAEHDVVVSVSFCRD